MDQLMDPIVDEDCIDINGTLMDQVMDILHTGGTFTINGILHNVLMATHSADVYDCLNNLESQQLVKRVGENPPLWQVVGNSQAEQNTKYSQSSHEPMDLGRHQDEFVSGNDFENQTSQNDYNEEFFYKPPPYREKTQEMFVGGNDFRHDISENDFNEKQSNNSPYQKHVSDHSNTVSSQPKGCPPPPSAALFQSLMSQCKHPSAPVPVAKTGRPLLQLPLNRGGSPNTPGPSAPYSPDGSSNESTGQYPHFKARKDYNERIENAPKGSPNSSKFGSSVTHQQSNSGGFPLQEKLSRNYHAPAGSESTPIPQLMDIQCSQSISPVTHRTPPSLVRVNEGSYLHTDKRSGARSLHQTGFHSGLPPGQTHSLPGQIAFPQGGPSSNQTGFPPNQTISPPSQTGFPPAQPHPPFETSVFPGHSSSGSFPQPPTAAMFKSLSSKGPQKTVDSKSGGLGANPRKPNLTAIQNQILKFMTENKKPCDTLQLSHACGLRTKKDVNPSLYQMQTLGLIIKMNDKPPTWKLRSDNLDLINSLINNTNNPPMSHSHRNAPQEFKVPENNSQQLNPFGKMSYDEKISQKVSHFANQSHFQSHSSQGFSQSQFKSFSQSNNASGFANQENQTQALSKIVHSSINQNPVSALNEYAQKNRLDLTYETVNEKRGFSVAVVLGGKMFPAARASNVKDARREACDFALRSLLGQKIGHNNELHIGQPSGETLRGAHTHFDLIAALSQHAFVQIAASIEENIAGRKVVACFVMKRGPGDTGQVVSLGSGNRCVTGERLSMEGKVVNDSHAEIVARRSLHRFFYAQVQSFYDGEESVFEQGNSSLYLTLKKDISFHLYISTAPCGDGALFTPRLDDVLTQHQSDNSQHIPEFTSKTQGILRTKIEDGEGTIPIDTSDGPQTWDGLLRGQRLRTMSCSDKICRWNVVGLQGALLSHFIEPIYLGSLTLGYLYDHGHLSRAVCCRLEHKSNLGAELNQPFKVNHPLLGRVTAYEASRHTEKTNNLSLNWAFGDTHAEVIDGRTGACLSRTRSIPTPARICKASLYGLFRELCLKTKRNELLNADTYREAKIAAKPFQEAKQKMFECFRKSKYGCWVSKPGEQEMF